jgi:hypothetical protein
MFAKTTKSSRGGAFTKTPFFFLCFTLIACASSLLLSANASYVCNDGSTPGSNGCCTVNGEEACPSCTAGKAVSVSGADSTCYCFGTAGDEAIIDARCATQEGCDAVLGETNSPYFSVAGCTKCYSSNGGKVCWPTEAVMNTCANYEKVIDPLNGQIKSDAGKVTCSASSSSTPTSTSASASASPSATAVGLFLATTMVAMLL